MPELITMYGTEWCGDCLRTCIFLKTHSIPYQFIDIDRDKNGENFVIKTNRGMRSVPTIVFTDGTLLIEPSNKMLAAKLGITIT